MYSSLSRGSQPIPQNLASTAKVSHQTRTSRGVIHRTSPSFETCLHLKHLCMNAQRNHQRESRQPSVHRDLPHYHLGPVDLKITRRILPTKPAYCADNRFNNTIKGTRALTSAH